MQMHSSKTQSGTIFTKCFVDFFRRKFFKQLFEFLNDYENKIQCPSAKVYERFVGWFVQNLVYCWHKNTETYTCTRLESTYKRRLIIRCGVSVCLTDSTMMAFCSICGPVLSSFCDNNEYCCSSRTLRLCFDNLYFKCRVNFERQAVHVQQVTINFLEQEKEVRDSVRKVHGNTVPSVCCVV